MGNVVLIIDMLRGFLEEEYPLFCGEKARQIIPNVKNLLQQEVDKGSKLFFICDNHDQNDLEFQIFPPHCIIGTKEAEIIPELGNFAGEVISKNRYSGFFNTNLDEKLKELDPDKLIVCGVCTDICVLHTIADARNRDYQVEVPSNCVASFNESGHQFALDHIEKVLGAHIVNT